MGEEFEMGKLFLRTPDGQMVEWNGIQEVKVVTGSEVDNEADKIYATLNMSDSIEFECKGQLTKDSYFWLMLGNKRLVRRALRWYEWLRRQEVKGKLVIGNKLDLAAQCARFKSNNGKHAHRLHTYTYTLRLEREDA